MLRRQLAVIAGPEAPRRVLLVCLAGICVLSVPVFCTRFLNDMDYYSLVSDKLMRGGVLYRNAIDTKPPLVFLHYATIFRLFGRDNVTAVKIVTMVCLFLSSLLVRDIYRELFPRSRRPELAALLFVLASFSGWGEDFLSSNTELLSNLFVLAGVWLMVRNDFASRARQLLPAGVLIGVACLYRYQAGAILAAYLFTLVCAPALRRGSLDGFDRPIWRLAMLGVGWLIPFAAIAAYYRRIGGVRDLAFLIQYQRFYVSAHALYWPQALGQVAVVLAGQAPFILLAGSQVSRMVRCPLGKRDLFLLMFLLFSVLPFFIGGHYFAHYIVQAIPAFVLLATERLYPSEDATANRRDGAVFRHARAFIAVTVAVFWMVNLAYYAARPAEAPAPDLVRFVRAQTDPKDLVFMWTQRSQVLFDFDRGYATRFLSNEFLTGRTYGSQHRSTKATAESARAAAVPELWPALLEDLETEKPRLIVDDAPEQSNFTIDHYPLLSAFVRTYYDRGQMMDGFCVYVRKAG
ncbi:MAG TPA: glycosyltransferase family 39 protein [Vicinamibacterales bacterium]|nr:glycosyltransferase family 39 protein [Vicinamibacterales bacterium]